MKYNAYKYDILRFQCLNWPYYSLTMSCVKMTATILLHNSLLAKLSLIWRFTGDQCVKSIFHDFICKWMSCMQMSIIRGVVLRENEFSGYTMSTTRLGHLSFKTTILFWWCLCVIINFPFTLKALKYTCLVTSSE